MSSKEIDVTQKKNPTDVVHWNGMNMRLFVIIFSDKF
jgi:hypothetical protein